MSPALAGGFLATGPPGKPNFKYSCVCMSIPNSPTIPSPHPFFLATISLFSKSVSLFLFCKEVHLYNIFFRFEYKGCHMIFLLLCLTYFTQYDNL